MNGLLCQLDGWIIIVARVYSLILLVYAVISWIPDLRGEWVRYLAMLVEPVLAPVRRIVPPVGGLDLAFLVVIIITSYIIPRLVAMSMGNVCLYP
ncbi:MAG TPA: YggT family protein [Candidatus Aquilonibacter sp.]|nr:YggT family protein [Candidatus Aquilonibacter sp.]